MARRPAPTSEQVLAALAHYEGVHEGFAGAELAPLGHGLINDTFAVSSAGGSFVLQRVHPVFSADIHRNIEAVTAHLAGKGIATPRLVHTRDDRTHCEVDGACWRLTTRMPGVTFDAASGLDQVESAAAMLGRFHAALDDLDHEFVGVRQGVHDTPKHLAHLRATLGQHRDHRRFAEVEPVAVAILDAARELPVIAALPDRVVHGDPKFNNLMFSAAEPAPWRATCLIDLDTVGRMPLHLELGDAWRSWCNPRGEDARSAHFDLEIFAASVRGYASACTIDLLPAEREALLFGVDWITLELASRFCADALTESYFGWDPARFDSASQHNLVRAMGQLSLHRQVVGCRTERAKVLASTLSS